MPNRLILLMSVMMLALSQPDRSAPAAPVDVSTLRIMSFNIRYGTAKDGEDRWDNRRELLMNSIETFRPDLLGVQEALNFQCDALREQLKGYDFVGVGRDDGKKKGEYSAILFRIDRFEKVDAGQFWLSKTPEVAGSKNWDAALTRIATWVKLKDKSLPNGPPVLVLNTHFDHVGVEARHESAKLIRKRLAELQPAGPVVLMGDINTTEDDPPYGEFIKPVEKGPLTLIDSYREVHPKRAPDEASFHAFKGGRTGSRIDFIMHTPGFRAIDATINYANKNGRYPSDHYPVTAVLEHAAK